MFRATLKSLLSRKLRLFLSAAAVVLGVMFVSGALVLTDTLGRSFDNLFTDIYQYTDIQVTKASDVPSLTGGPTPANMPAADVSRVASIAGVRSATGLVFADGARVVGKNGKVVPGTGGPRFGTNWTGHDELVALRQGRGPTAADEVAISANLAKTTGYAVGDQIGVLTLKPKQMFTIVGIFGYVGGRDSLAGETTVAFTDATAQELMLGESGVYSQIQVVVDDKAQLAQVRDRIAASLAAGYDVKTGDQLASDSSAGLKKVLGYFNYLLLGFAGVALFVGIFLILNTFSIIVAQRTRELALFRAMGASRNQVITSVLIEAAVIGLFASVVGLGLGVAVGAGLGAVMGSALSGGSLALAGLAVPGAAIGAAFGVGLGVTMLAALLPAVRASRIAPVAAMRESATPDRPLTRQTISGAVVLAIGGTLLGLGLTGNLGGANLSGVLGGLLICFLGVALLTPAIARPVVTLLGRAFSRTAAGKLGRRNSARNPRRTAITAAALMVTIALVTGISVIFSSIRSSTVDAVNTGVHAQFVVAGEALSGGLAAIDPAAVARMGDVSGVKSVVATYVDLAKVDGKPAIVGGVNDIAAAAAMFDITAVSGRVDALPPGTVIVDSTSAKQYGIGLGSVITVQFARGPVHTYTVTGVYQRTSTLQGFFFPTQDVVAAFHSPAPMRAFIAVSEGANTTTVRQQVDALIANSPEVSLSSMDDFVAQQVQVFDIILIFVQLLLGLAMIIAVLGIINTLALSMIERTKELGLLRAVGMRRGQVMWMISVESVVISVFGALLGIAVGCGLGVAVFRALHDQGFTTLAFPWPLMAIYLVASVVVGLAAALIPAIRAARLDVLKAIAYE